MYSQSILSLVIIFCFMCVQIASNGTSVYNNSISNYSNTRLVTDLGLVSNNTAGSNDSQLVNSLRKKTEYFAKNTNMIKIINSFATPPTIKDDNKNESAQSNLTHPEKTTFNENSEKDIKINISDHNKSSVIKRFSDLKEDISKTNAANGTAAMNTDSENKKISCIECSNIDMAECNSPLGKRVSTVQCSNADDLCYSQHTPFGMVNRGCYNMNNNVNTFVCSCNLCNYISFLEMPYIFSNHQEWAKNVEELSRMIHFRKSIYKSMSCLSCFVNTTNTKGIDSDENAYCLDGNVIKVPSTECPQDEICGVKSQRSTGYLWRGCLKTPLYNYWYGLCDSDNCNNDEIVSLINM